MKHGKEKSLGLAFLTTVAFVAFAGTGCSTKRYVRNTIAPVEQRVGELDKKTTAQAGSIDELEKGVSRADERAQGADMPPLRRTKLLCRPVRVRTKRNPWPNRS
jgi:hypothetical protein